MPCAVVVDPVPQGSTASFHHPLEETGRETSHDAKQPNVVTMCQAELSNSVHVEVGEVVVSKCLVIEVVVCALPGRGASVP